MKPVKKMKTFKTLTITLIAIMLTSRLIASGDHGHEHETKDIVTPNAGRLIQSVMPNFEFFVTKERKIQLTFLDCEGQIIEPTSMEISVISGNRANPLSLTLLREGQILISEQTLPDGDNLPIILRIKEFPTSKPIWERFHLRLSPCPTCDHAEYACVCEHENEHSGHAHEDEHSGHQH